tara:strand:- start:1 stop:567 length:567 start_codon:yes stop_codon:yes gene_type:complete
MSYAEFDYWTLKKYVPDYICDEIVKNHTDFEGARSSTRPWNTDERENYRKSDIYWIKDPFYKHLFFDVISRENYDSGLNFQLEYIEDLQLTRYIAPDGHYNFHRDDDGHSRRNIDDSVRKISVTCLLTDPSEFEGGNFQILTSDTPYDVKLEKGDIIMFPSYLLHRVSPVTKGVRHSLVAWANGRAFV